MGYRGLDPHRSQFTQILKDGIPIHADQFGYPEAYYLPPLDSIEQINFVHGGASLLFGPQLGGARAVGADARGRGARWHPPSWANELRTVDPYE